MPFPTDPFSAATHLAGAIAAAIAGVALVRRARGNTARVTATAVFAASAVTLLLASTLFHAVPAATPARAITQRIDHAAIFILIAGTFTPIHAILFRGPLRWGVLTLAWTAAIVGATVKTIYFASVPEWAGIGAYLAMGWMGVLSMALIFRRFGARFVSPLVVGGMAYTAGAMCEFTAEPTLIAGIIGPHEVFHIAVLAGLGCMWMFIHRIAIGCEGRSEQSCDAQTGEPLRTAA